MLWIKNLASGSFLVLSTHILHFHKKTLPYSTFLGSLFCKVDYSRNELLKIAVKGPARILAWFFSIQAGTLSGPVALFVLTFLRAWKVWWLNRWHIHPVVGLFQRRPHYSYLVFLYSRGRCSLTADTKKSFILLASSSTFPSVVLLARPCTFDLSVVFWPINFFIFFHQLFVSDSCIASMHVW